jgi:hypothetical protein
MALGHKWKPREHDVLLRATSTSRASWLLLFFEKSNDFHARARFKTGIRNHLIAQWYPPNPKRCTAPVLANHRYRKYLPVIYAAGNLPVLGTTPLESQKYRRPTRAASLERVLVPQAAKAYTAPL